MKRSNRLVIFVGVLLAILAFVGIVILLNSTQNTNPSGTGPTTKVTVLIANQDIKIGDPVTPDKVSEQQIDPNGVSGTPFGSKSAVAGQPALVNIPKGSQVNKEALGGGTGSQCVSCQLKPGEKAIAFQVDKVTGLSFLIQPGDHIDIVMSQKITPVQTTSDTVGKPASQQRFETVPGLDQAPTVKTVLQNKRVLYVSQTIIKPATQPAASASPSPGAQQQTQQTAQDLTIIVIAGTDQDAEAIKFAQNDANATGLLTAVLRSSQDSVVERTTGITLERLVTQYGLVVPNIVKLPVK